MTAPAAPLTIDSYWPETYLRPGLGPDHCADVLEGVYDTSYNPLTPPVILDIGGNVGAFVRWAVRRWPGCTIHSYEPHPENFALLTATLRDLISPEAAANVFLHNHAVWSSATQTVLTPGYCNCGEHSLFNPRGEGKPVPGSLRLTTVDAATLPKAQVLKIDAEGSELGILLRLAEVGSLTPLQSVALEWHTDDLAAKTEALLTTNGFTVEARRAAVTTYVRKPVLLPFGGKAV